MIFWRIYNNKLYTAGEVEKLGFPISSPSYIPDEYLDEKNFLILRTCFAVGDWGIISALPRKLKEKYPDCKVWIPSPKMLENIFGPIQNSVWDKPYEVVHHIFNNNPYVDGFIDSYDGEVFHDHYRIYDKEEEPLMEQILRFWQIDNFEDIDPELYFTPEEKELGDKIIEEHCDGEFGSLLVTRKYKDEYLPKFQEKIDEYDLPMFYWMSAPDIKLNFKKALDLRHIHPRIQLYIRSKSVFNVGVQSGVLDTISRYSKTFCVIRGDLRSNKLYCQNYI